MRSRPVARVFALGNATRTTTGEGAPMHGRRWLSILVAALVFVTTAVVSTAPSGANHASIFELDGNVADDQGAAGQQPWDWTKFFGTTGNRITPLPSDFLDSAFDNDHLFQTSTGTTTTDLSTYTGGSKDTLDISGWSCANANNLGGKFDILNAYSTIYEVPSTGDGYTAGDLLLFFGIERAATEGDGNMGFWFLKNGVDCEKPLGSGGSPQPFTGGLHQDGDVFVVAGFSNGGTKATVTAYLWKDADGSGGAAGFLDVDNPFVTGALCAGGTHEACGVVNTAPLDTPWPSPDKSGGDLDTNAFYEGFVQVPVAQVSGCFATFVANTRSSTSPTATIHDFSRGSFPTCQPSTTMTGLATPTTASPEVVVVGDQVTYTFPEKNDGNLTLTDVHVVTDNADCNAVLTPPSVASLAPDATATFSCTLTTGTTPAVTTIRAVGHGTATIGSQAKDVTVCGANAIASSTAPTTKHCDADEQDSAKSVSIEPGTEMTINASPTTVKQGDTVTFTITEKNDGVAPSGYESYLDLTSVAVTTDSSGCNTTLARTIPNDGGADTTLSQNETWTYQCTVTAPSDDFTVVATGTGTVLAGTSHARNVTYSATCANSSGTSTTTGTYCDSEEQVNKTVTVIAPSTSLRINASAVITYTFRETNDSADAPLIPPTPTVRESVITAEEGITSVCDTTPLAYQSGDTGDDKILGVGETWVFTCTGTLTGPTGDNGPPSSTSKVATGIGHGNDATGTDVTYCTGTQTGKLCDSSERDRVTVTITGQPQGADPTP